MYWECENVGGGLQQTASPLERGDPLFMSANRKLIRHYPALEDFGMSHSSFWSVIFVIYRMDDL